ncbi:UNVERIFIED_CONTAM: hypothetical protein FKN15_054418 [Acipenser sinensis]
MIPFQQLMEWTSSGLKDLTASAWGRTPLRRAGMPKARRPFFICHIKVLTGRIKAVSGPRLAGSPYVMHPWSIGTWHADIAVRYVQRPVQDPLTPLPAQTAPHPNPGCHHLMAVYHSKHYTLAQVGGMPSGPTRVRRLLCLPRPPPTTVGLVCHYRLMIVYHSHPYAFAQIRGLPPPMQALVTARHQRFPLSRIGTWERSIADTC